MADFLDTPGYHLPDRQWVIFVRHAESRWNRSQNNRSVLGLICENDHGLSQEGRVQAETLRQRLQSYAQGAKAEHPNSGQGNVFMVHPEEPEWTRRMIAPDKVFCSPFTRAIATAAIGLQDVVRNQPIVLLREAREHKNILGADSTGIAIGEEIPEHVAKEIAGLYEGFENRTPEDAEKEFRRIEIDYSSCEVEWWGPITGDDEAQLHENINSVISRLRMTRGSEPGGGGASILVGHSYFLRNIFKLYLSDNLINPIIGVSEALRCSLIPNCGVIGARFDWDKAGCPRIREVVPLLGTQLTFDPLQLPGEDNGTTQSLVSGCACARRDLLPDSCTIS